MMANPKVEVALQCCCPSIGEGPHWDVASQSLLFVDIKTGGVHQWNPETNVETKINLDGSVGFVVPRDKGGLAVGLNRTVSLVDLGSTDTKVLMEVEPGTKNRFNDAKCDAAGRLLAGTMGYEEIPGVVPKGQGNLYCINTDLTYSKQDSGIDISNGIDWTDDNKTMYYIDSVPRHVYAYDYDFSSGSVSNRRVVVDYEKAGAGGLPDGMCIDCDGKIWVASFSVGEVKRFDPQTGQTLQTLSFPTTNITSVCFGGKNLDELFVTSSAWKLPEGKAQPLAGSVFRVTGLGTKGRAPNNFKG